MWGLPVEGSDNQRRRLKATSDRKDSIARSSAFDRIEEDKRAEEDKKRKGGREYLGG